MVPKGIANARAEHKDIYHERDRTSQINKLGAFVTALGGPSASRPAAGRCSTWST